MRILYVSPDISWPLSFGGDIRKWNVLQGLLQAGETDALVLLRPGRRLSPEAFTGCGRILPVNDVAMTEREARMYGSTIGRGLLTLGRQLPYEYLGGSRPELRDELERLVPFESYDLVWFAGARRAIHVVPLTCGPTILDGDDFEYVREYLVLRSEPWYGAKVWNYVNVVKLWAMERAFHRRFSGVVRCSPDDARRHAAANVVVIPNGTVVPPETPWRPDRRLLFVGDLGYTPNRQGLEWFLESVWPAVRRAVPDAQLDLVGRNATWALTTAHGKNGVVVHGFVDDLAPFYRRAASSIAPLFAGGGTRLKILESLAYAVPVVSTRLGAFGIDVPPGHGLVLADTPVEFAARCAEFLMATEAPISPAKVGRDLVAARYDWQAIRSAVARAAIAVVAETRGREGGRSCASSI
jgi:glycosyltransferase involved in cell wall biosynthesis